MVALYFTTVVYGQWALFAGRNPYGAAFLVGGILFVAGSIADLLVATAARNRWLFPLRRSFSRFSMAVPQESASVPWLTWG